MLILLDQDGVLADFERGFLNEWRRRHPYRMYVPLGDRISWKMHEDYPPEFKEDIRAIYQSPGFFRNLPPIKGALNAVRYLVDVEEHDVRICTSPLDQYENCVAEKYEWVEEHLGFEFTKKIILVKDKTLVRGDVLIDDRPKVSGSLVPEWQHLIFDRPYNNGAPGTHINWTNCRTVLKNVLEVL